MEMGINTIMEDNKQMKNTNNTINYEQGLNVCPICGRKAYAVYTDDGIYRVGCLHCGLQHGVGTHAGDLTDEMKDNLRRSWNMKMLGSYIEPEAREALELRNSGYVITTSADGYIVGTVDDMREVMNYLDMVGDDVSHDIYMHNDGTIMNLGTSFFAWQIVEAARTKPI